jgi:hypothetical protein
VGGRGRRHRAPRPGRGHLPVAGRLRTRPAAPQQRRRRPARAGPRRGRRGADAGADPAGGRPGAGRRLVVVTRDGPTGPALDSFLGALRDQAYRLRGTTAAERG